MVEAQGFSKKAKVRPLLKRENPWGFLKGVGPPEVA
jgi:hypothetical protein